MTEAKHTCKPTVMLSRAISFFPAFREIGVFNLKGGCVPFPDALAEDQAYMTTISMSYLLKKKQVVYYSQNLKPV